MRVVRIVVRGVVALALVLVVALAAAYAFTFTDRFRELARTELVGYLAGAFQGEVAIGRIEGSIWGDLRLSDVTVRYREKEIARFPVVVLRYALLPVLGGKVQVTSIEAADPTLDLVADEHGNWNLVDALGSRTPPPPAETGSGLAIALESVVLRGAAIRITPEGSPTYVVTDVSLDATIDVLGAGTNASLRSLTFQLAREGLPVVRTDAALVYAGAESPPRVTVSRLVVSTEASKAALAGEVRNLAALKDMEVRADLTLDALGPGDVKLFVPQWSSPDTLSGRLQLSGKTSALRAESALAVGEAKLQATATADVAADLPHYDATVAIEKLDVAKLVAALGVAGVIDGKVAAKGVGTDPAAVNGNADVTVRGLASSGWQLGDVTAVASVADRHATAETRVRIDGAERAKLDATADLAESQSYRIALVTSHFNPKRVSAEHAPLAGDVNLRATVEGRGYDPAKAEARAQMDVNPSKLGSVAIDRGRFDVALAAGRAKIAKASLRAKGATLEASGDVGVDPNARGQLAYDLSVADLRPWLELAGQEGGGALAVKGTANGTLSSLAANGRLQAKQLRVATASVGSADVTYAARDLGRPEPQGRVTASLQNVEAGTAVRDLKADVTLREKGRFSVELSATDSASRAHHLAGEGRLAMPDVDLRLTDLSLGSSQGPWRIVGPAVLVLRRQELTITGFDLANGDRHVRLGGSVAPRGRQQLRLEIDRFTLDTVQPLLAGAPKMAGVVSANAEVGGTASAPTLAAHLAITSLEIAGQKYEGIDASARYGAGALNAEVNFRQDAAHVLTATAKAPMLVRWDPAWSARPNGDADLALRSSGLSLAALNAFTGRSIRDVSGELAADVTAKGPFDHLQPRGMLELRQAGFVIPMLGTAVREGSIVIRFDAREARLERFSARGGDGTLEGSGVVPLAATSSEPMRLAFEAKHFRAASNHRYRADVEGQVAIGGTPSAPEVRGRVEVIDAALRPDIAFLTKQPKPRDETIRVVTVGAPEPAPNAAPVPKPPSLYDKATIDLAVAIRRNSWIRHEEAAVDLEGEVRTTKAPARALSVVGEVHTMRGWAVLQGRRFTVSRGSIAFTGGPEIDPTLDVVADYKAGDYTVHAIVSGTANAPALTLASEPSLEQADIVSVLLFGKPAKDLNDGQKTDLKAKAAEIAGSYAFTEIGQSVTRALGLESKGIQVEELSTERVALGTYLTEKTYVTLGQNIGDKKGQELGVQYEFIPHWSVETSTSTVGGSGLDLIWHRSY